MVVSDALLTGLSGGVSATYAYRADGMRVSKLAGGTMTRYRHDGQMGVEDVETQGASTVVTRYGLGARGVKRPKRPRTRRGLTKPYRRAIELDARSPSPRTLRSHPP